eukprot:4327943-Pyramimonas_sp.AAC.1
MGEPFLHRVPWEAIRMLLQLLPTSWVFPMIKTWVSAWLTRYRICCPSGRRRCIFGCSTFSDRQCHYVRCRRLCRAVGHALGRSPPALLHERLCLTALYVERVEAVVVMYTTYHAIRFRDWVSPSALSSAARAAVRTLRMASPTD